MMSNMKSVFLVVLSLLSMHSSVSVKCPVCQDKQCFEDVLQECESRVPLFAQKRLALSGLNQVCVSVEYFQDGISSKVKDCALGSEITICNKFYEEYGKENVKCLVTPAHFFNRQNYNLTNVKDDGEDGNSSESPQTSPDGNSSETPQTSPDGNSSETPQTSPDGESSETPQTSPDGNSSEAPQTSPDGNSSETPQTSPDGSSSETPQTSSDGNSSETPQTSSDGSSEASSDQPSSSSGSSESPTSTVPTTTDTSDGSVKFSHVSAVVLLVISIVILLLN